MAGKKVLVVDDDEDVADSIKAVFEMLFDFECDVCLDESAQLITKKVSAFNPCAIIMDYMYTPGLSFEELVRQIKKENLNVIIILYTGVTLPGLVSLFEKLIAEDIVQGLFFKPVSCTEAGEFLQELF